MKFLIDMNLGLEWIACLSGSGYDAAHWHSIGASEASDDEIMRWARDRNWIILTADLDFGISIVRSGEAGPSVVQLRTEETLVRTIGARVLAAIKEASDDLTSEALVTIADHGHRIRSLSSPRDT